MNTTLRELRASLSRPTLELVVANLIGIGALIVLVAEAGLIAYSDAIYVVGENLLIVGSIASVLLVLTHLQTSDPNEEVPRGVSLRMSAALGVGAFGGAALLLAREGGLSVYSAAIGLLIALSLFIALNATTTADESLEARDWGIGFRSIAIGIAVMLALTSLLRLMASSSDLLTYFLAPITVFILPGLALTLVLKDEETPVYVHLALIPVLSIASQLIVIAWLLWLRVPLTPLAMLIGCAAITLGGLAARLIVNWRAERTMNG